MNLKRPCDGVNPILLLERYYLSFVWFLTIYFVFDTIARLSSFVKKYAKGVFLQKNGMIGMRKQEACIIMIVKGENE